MDGAKQGNSNEREAFTELERSDDVRAGEFLQHLIRLNNVRGEDERDSSTVGITMEEARHISSPPQCLTSFMDESGENSIFFYPIVPSELVLSGWVNSNQPLRGYKKNWTKSLRNSIPEILASCLATSFHFVIGVNFAATASLLPQLEAEDSDIKATKTEIAWIASIFVLVLPVASIFSSFVMETFGRLKAVKLSIVPSVASCILTAMSTDIYMLIGGRLLMGIGAALGSNPAVVYITEITSPKYRGALICAGPTLSSLGMMIGYLSGAFLPWRTVSWMNIFYCFLPYLLILIAYVPESPTWLVSKERVEQARENLFWLAKFEEESSRERIVEEKLKKLIRDRNEKLRSGRGGSFFKRMYGLSKPSGYKPLIIMIVLFALQQYSGVYIITFYAVQFFESAGSLMDPFHASILIGLMRFIMSVFTIFLLKVFGRRPLCLISCFGMALFMGISGLYTRRVMQTGENSMIPVYAILLYVCFCMIGLLSVPWTMAAEVFPTEIRGMAHGMVIASAHLIMFASVKTYYDMTELLGGHDKLQWFFAGISIVAFVFVYFFLPETHKLSLLEIEEYFTHNTCYVTKKTRRNRGGERNCRRARERVQFSREREGNLPVSAANDPGASHLNNIDTSDIELQIFPKRLNINRNLELYNRSN